MEPWEANFGIQAAKVDLPGLQNGFPNGPLGSQNGPPLEAWRARFEHQDDDCRFISSVYDTI